MSRAELKKSLLRAAAVSRLAAQLFARPGDDIESDFGPGAAWLQLQDHPGATDLELARRLGSAGWRRGRAGFGSSNSDADGGDDKRVWLAGDPLGLDSARADPLHQALSLLDAEEQAARVGRAEADRLAELDSADSSELAKRDGCTPRRIQQDLVDRRAALLLGQRELFGEES
jgi:hypothetical protein